MKLSAIFTLFLMLFVNEAMAQRRPYPGPGPGPVPGPRPVPYPRRPVPVPQPRPVPVPAPEFLCRGADLYRYNWLIHRFRWTNDCHDALRDVHYRGRFCDEGAQYDWNGNFIRQYNDQFECRRWL